MLYCPNYSCQTLNAETHRFCQKCRSPLPKRYLWAVGQDVEAFQPGQLLTERYLCKTSRIFLDTKPGLLPSGYQSDIPESYQPYLRLVSYRLHIPQFYERVQTDAVSSILLLDQAPIEIIQTNAGPDPQVEAAVDGVKVSLFPSLTECWQQASALRQLNWLWQMAQLWQPLNSEGVVSSLLMPDLLRVEGPIFQLLELQMDSAAKTAPDLKQLGQLWSQWAAIARPEIAAFLQALCQQLIQGQIWNAEQLVIQLDRGLATAGQPQARQVQVATQIDQGPSRQRNEDACYPVGGTVKSHVIEGQVEGRAQTSVQDSLLIVCDGIGGHQGGDVASNLAIAAIQQQLQSVQPEALEPDALIVKLEDAIRLANDQISQKNDQEQRRDRQRMGTTLVMSLLRAHELYLAHVGDSRAYWITRWGCHQITLDDDIAAREVRLGYSSYREALQQPSSGSLVQALGMGPSQSLHPTVQRFILDEDSLFLLCSDGLSDGDRVEEYWQEALLPILAGQLDLATASQRLVEIANTCNGHDNVTVGLVYCQVQERASIQVSPDCLMTFSALPQTQIKTKAGAAYPSSDPKSPTVPASSALKTQILSPTPQPKQNLLSLLLGILLLISFGGLLAYFFFPSVSQWVDPRIGLAPTSTPPSQPATPVTPTPPVSPTEVNLTTGALVQVRLPISEPQAAAADNSVVLQLQPPFASATLPDEDSDQNALTEQAVVPIGAVLQVLSKREASGQLRWIQLKVCSLPANAGAERGRATPSASAEAAVVLADQPALTENTLARPASLDAETEEFPAQIAPSLRLLQPGEIGWIPERMIAARVESPSLSAEQRGECGAAPGSTFPTPSDLEEPFPQAP